MAGDCPLPGDFPSNMAIFFAKLLNPSNISLLMGSNVQDYNASPTGLDHHTPMATPASHVDTTQQDVVLPYSTSNPYNNPAQNPNPQDFQEPRSTIQDSRRVLPPTTHSIAPNVAASLLGGADTLTGNIVPPLSNFIYDHHS